MPKVVKAHARQTCFGEEWVQRPAENVSAIQRFSEAVRKHQAVLSPGLLSFSPLRSLPVTMSL
jgi:hypothetical protein